MTIENLHLIMAQIKLLMNSFEPLLSRYQGNLETSMRGSDFIFDSVQLMHYKCHKVNFKFGASYIESQDWIKNKK